MLLPDAGNPEVVLRIGVRLTPSPDDNDGDLDAKVCFFVEDNGLLRIGVLDDEALILRGVVSKDLEVVADGALPALVTREVGTGDKGNLSSGIKFSDEGFLPRDNLWFFKPPPLTLLRLRAT